MQKARAMPDEFKIANHSIQQPRGNLREFWTLPPEHSYKVNVDSSLCSYSASWCRCGYKDHEGKVTAAMSKKIHQPLGPLEIEAKAMEEGISFA